MTCLQSRLPSVFLAAIMAVAAIGCNKVVSLRFYNHTDDSVDIELDGPGFDDADIGRVPPYGYYRFDFEIDDYWLPAHYELEADEDVEFTVNEYTPERLYIDILDDEVIGPRRRPIRDCGCPGCRRGW